MMENNFLPFHTKTYNIGTRVSRVVIEDKEYIEICKYHQLENTFSISYIENFDNCLKIYS